MRKPVEIEEEDKVTEQEGGNADDDAGSDGHDVLVCQLTVRFTSNHKPTLQYRHIPNPAMFRPATRRFLSTRPWFVDPEPVVTRQLPPHLAPKSHDLPPDLPVPVKELFHTLGQSPFLEPSTLEVKAPSPVSPGPPLPKTIPKGRRGRGRTYSGEGIPYEQGGIWNWFLIAQVKHSKNILSPRAEHWKGQGRNRKPGFRRGRHQTGTENGQSIDLASPVHISHSH